MILCPASESIKLQYLAGNLKREVIDGKERILVCAGRPMYLLVIFLTLLGIRFPTCTLAWA
jgi:hypothetical protein